MANTNVAEALGELADEVARRMVTPVRTGLHGVALAAYRLGGLRALDEFLHERVGFTEEFDRTRRKVMKDILGGSVLNREDAAVAYSALTKLRVLACGKPLSGDRHRLSEEAVAAVERIWPDLSEGGA